jgi:hypothetical protein
VRIPISISWHKHEVFAPPGSPHNERKTQIRAILDRDGVPVFTGGAWLIEEHCRTGRLPPGFPALEFGSPSIYQILWCPLDSKPLMLQPAVECVQVVCRSRKVRFAAEEIDRSQELIVCLPQCFNAVLELLASERPVARRHRPVIETRRVATANSAPAATDAGVDFSN